MAPNKRKRASDGSTPSEEGSTDANSTPAVPADPVPFTLQLLRKGQQNSKRQKKDDGRWTSPREEISPLPNAAPIFYKVAPRDAWEGMKKYKQFVVQESTFSIGDYVFISNGASAASDTAPDDKELWVARVMECRAESPSSVWIRVMYLYWPHELPDHLKRSYYGVRELIVSNHMEIIDAQCVEDKAEVVEASESDESVAPALSLYWRQFFDFLENKVSPPLRRDCICNQPHNPDYLLIRCPSETCGKWMHEDCLVKEACRKQWQRTTNGGSTAEAAKEEDSTIKVDVDGGASSPSKGTKGMAIKKARPGKRKSKPGEKEEEPWDGVLEGKIERAPSDDDSTTEISGDCIIKRLSGDGPSEVREPLFCLFCDTALGAKGEPLTPPRDS